MGERFKDPSKSFMCSFLDCKASFSKSWKLEAHYCKHTGLRPFACDGCDKSFCTRYLLTRHNLSHSGEKPYHCLVDGCSEGFSSTAGLKNHIERVHQNKEKHYVCDYKGCLKAFRKNNQLKSHQSNSYRCLHEGCGKKYASPKQLHKHEKVHDGYPCAEAGCDFLGKTWTEYQAHRKLVHRETLQCDSCAKVFHKAWLLKKHKLFVHLKTRHVFKCPKEGCLKTYTTQFNLQSHVLSFHEGKCSFVCPSDGCGKAFAMEESLKRHAVVHDPQKKEMQTKRGWKDKAKATADVSDASNLSAQLQSLSLKKSKSQNKP